MHLKVCIHASVCACLCVCMHLKVCIHASVCVCVYESDSVLTVGVFTRIGLLRNSSLYYCCSNNNRYTA